MRSLWSSIGMVLVLVGLFFFFNRCGKESEPTYEATFTSLYSYMSSCGESRCHAPGSDVLISSVTNLDLSTKANAYSSLKQNALIPGKTTCTGKYVVDGNPDLSMLVAVLDDDVRDSYDAATGCGVATFSSHGINPPPANFMTALRQWITNGALDN